MQIVEGNALPTLILMLRSEDVGIHYEAVRIKFPTLSSILFCFHTGTIQLAVLLCSLRRHFVRV